MSEKELERKKEVFEKRLGTTHWPVSLFSPPTSRFECIQTDFPCVAPECYPGRERQR